MTQAKQLVATRAISADSHITEPADTYIANIDSRWKDKAPRLENLGEAGDMFVIDGMKTDGIESVLKIVKQRHAVQPPLSKAHGKVFWLTKTENTNPFADWAGASVATPNVDGFLTAAGMFSPDASDAGSGLLAETIGTFLKGKIHIGIFPSQISNDSSGKRIASTRWIYNFS